MDNEGSVNNQITDAVTQMNTLLLGASSAQSMGLVDVAGAETLSMSMYNAVSSQQNSQVAASASVTATCAKMLQAEAIKSAPEAADNTASSETPPPFMPLNGKSGTASELISQASILADSAVRLLDENKQSGNDNSADLQKLITTLQSYAKSESSESKPAASSSNDSSDAGSQTDSKAGDDDAKKDQG